VLIDGWGGAPFFMSRYFLISFSFCSLRCARLSVFVLSSLLPLAIEKGGRWCPSSSQSTAHFSAHSPDPSSVPCVAHIVCTATTLSSYLHTRVLTRDIRT
jgi:hypothetical protein